MATLTVYDPPLCCSSGVCEPANDPILTKFATDLDWLAGNGISIARYNFAQTPGAFVENHVVHAALHEKGSKCLPLILVDDQIVSSGVYPITVPQPV